MSIRPVEIADAGAWSRLRVSLWPDSADDTATEIASYFAGSRSRTACFVAEIAGGGLIGFVEVRLREYAEGCRSCPVGYLEGIFVDTAHRGRGVGRALVQAGEAWARSRGCTEMGSDRAVANEPSGAFHAAVGYEEVGPIICLRKSLT